MKAYKKRRLFQISTVAAFLAAAALSGLAEPDRASLWGRAVGGSQDDFIKMIVPSSGGGLYAVGKTLSFGGGADAWLLSLDASGRVKWQRRCGGWKNDEAVRIRPTADGGFVVLGTTESYGVGGADFWVLKLDVKGGLEWQKAYGGWDDEYGSDIQPMADGGYLVIGSSWTFGQATQNTNSSSVWILKLNDKGVIYWQQSYKIGKEKPDTPRVLIPTSDGGYLTAGYTLSKDASQNIWLDGWAMKIDAYGKPAWTRFIDGAASDSIESAIETTEGAYLLAGKTSSYGAGDYDVWVTKVSARGGFLWQKTYGGPESDSAAWIQEVKKGQYVLGGRTSSFGKGDRDALALKLNASGDILWQYAYGGPADDRAEMILALPDGRCVLAGQAGSFGAGLADGLLLLLSGTGKSGAAITTKADLAVQSVRSAFLLRQVVPKVTKGTSALTAVKFAPTAGVVTPIFN